MASAEDTKQRIASLVFLDFESTGIPAYEFRSRATEICLIAVERVHFQSLEEKGQDIRIQNKLRLCFYPRKRMSPNSTYLTGLSNENLQNQKPMNEDFVVALCAFLKRLPAPVCLIAHNGNEFDFPLLQAEVRNLGCMLPEDILCADSYCAFRSLLENLSTEIKFLRDPFKVVDRTRCSESVPDEFGKPIVVHNRLDEEDDSLNEELALWHTYTGESLGFTVDYDDVSSNEEYTSEFSPYKNDVKVNAELVMGSKVVKESVTPTVTYENDDKSDSTSAQEYEEILINCDNPDCEWPNCKCFDLDKHLVSDDINNGGKSGAKQTCANGIRKELPADNAIITNGKNVIRQSTIVSVSTAGSITTSPSTSLPKSPLEAYRKFSNQLNQNTEIMSNNVAIEEHNLEVDAILQHDMEFVVSYILSPDFQKMEAEYELEALKLESDKTPIRTITMPPLTSRHTWKCKSQSAELLTRNKIHQEEEHEEIVCVENHDRVKKRLFPVEIQSKVIAAPNLDLDESSVTNQNGTVKSYNGNVTEDEVSATICKMPSKRICNGVASINNSHSNDNTNLLASRAHLKQYCSGVTSVTNVQVLDIHGEAKNLTCKYVSNLPNEDFGKKTVMVPAQTKKDEALVQPSTAAAGVSGLGRSTYLTQPTQKGTQRAKYKYSLVALHELLVGSTPTVSHTAEDDTETLMRLCRTKSKDFCEWIDNHAIQLNLVPPMWEQKSSGFVRKP